MTRLTDDDKKIVAEIQSVCDPLSMVSDLGNKLKIVFGECISATVNPVSLDSYSHDLMLVGEFAGIREEYMDMLFNNPDTFNLVQKLFKNWAKSLDKK